MQTLRPGTSKLRVSVRVRVRVRVTRSHLLASVHSLGELVALKIRVMVRVTLLRELVGLTVAGADFLGKVATRLRF